MELMTDEEFRQAQKRVFEALVAAARRGPTSVAEEMEKLEPDAVRWVLLYAVMRERDRIDKGRLGNGQPPADPSKELAQSQSRQFVT